MDLEQFTAEIAHLASAAGSSNDETVKRLAGCLLSMQASIVAGDPLLDSFIDQMPAMNRRLAETHRKFGGLK